MNTNVNTKSITWNILELGLSQRTIEEEFINKIFHLDTNMSKGRLSDLINGINPGKSYKFLEELGRTTRSSKTGKLYTYKDFPFLVDSENCWSNYINKLNPSEIDSLKSKVDEIFSYNFNISFDDKTEIKWDLTEKLKSIINNDISYKLSVYALLSTTWPYWDAVRTSNYHNKDKKLVNNLLSSVISKLFPLELEDSPKTCDDISDTYNITKEYKDAESAFLRGDYEVANNIFTKIVTQYLTASNNLLGNSYSYLIKCRANLKSNVSSLWTKNELEYWANHYGSSDINPRKSDIHTLPDRGTSLEPGTCIFNQIDNDLHTKKIYNWIVKSCPSNWDCKDLNDVTTNLKNIFDKKIRFIFINSNYSKNIEDALQVIDLIKELQAIDNIYYENCEVIIRCEEEETIPILDTACSLLNPDYPPVKIYLIDEKKRTADYLLSQHPLFYPLTFSFNKEKSKSAIRNLVIVSDNSDTDYATWLIRESFWLLPQTYASTTKISVISPNSDEITAKLVTKCPGLTQFINSVDITSGKVTPQEGDIDIDDIDFPTINFYNISPNSPAFTTMYAEICMPNDLPYCVIDSNSDLTSIYLAKLIREICIRNAIQHRRLNYFSSDSYVIAARIFDADYARLTNELIVPKETEHDDLWYNDYKLTTFGSINDLFSWEQLTGGPIEFLSECMHYQYCSQDDKYDFNQPAPLNYKESYFHRLYNRDSSFAAAMSLPYRLFDVGIFLKRWHISENTYWLQQNRDELATSIDKLFKEKKDENKYDELIKQLAKYEHNRWVCYMLSRGWLPASPWQTISYINNGVDRHTLQIAKLHPCLCSWNNLTNLYTNLHLEYLGNADSYGKYHPNELFKAYKNEEFDKFQTIDLNNIKQTADILRAQPIKEKISVLEHTL